MSLPGNYVGSYNIPSLSIPVNDVGTDRTAFLSIPGYYVGTDIITSRYYFPVTSLHNTVEKKKKKKHMGPSSQGSHTVLRVVL